MGSVNNKVWREKIFKNLSDHRIWNEQKCRDDDHKDN